MFKGLTDRAKKILTVLAQEEGRKNGSEQLLPEHVLLAMLRQGEGRAILILKALKINILSFQLALEQSLPLKTSVMSFGDLPASRRLRTLLDVAQIEARSFRQEYVGTEHLLLAAIKEEKSVCASFFEKLNLTIEDARKAADVLSHASNEEIQNIAGRDYQQPRYPVFPQMQTAGGPSASMNQQQGRAQTNGILKNYSRDLTALARAQKLDPVIGRDAEIARVIQILSRRSKNNPVLVGEPGVGKTAIVEGLAQRIISERVPRNLCKKRVLTLDLASVVAGTKYRGEFEERFKRIMKEATENKNIILFIDELHTLIGTGGAEGAMDASNLLKPALSRGEIQCIGATTSKEFRQYFEKDAALARRFQKVNVEEPSDADVRLILEGLKKKYEEFHGVIYDDDVVDTILRYSRRFITDRFFPDKAIDVLDEAGSMKKIAADIRPPELSDIEANIEQLNKEKQQLVNSQNYERAAEVRDQVRELRQKLDIVRNYWQMADVNGSNVVTSNDIKKVLAIMTGIPLENIDTSESAKLINMEAELHKTVVGQDEAVSLISSAIRRSRSGISSVRRPLGSFIFLGPTGVGKTLLAKTLAKFLFGTEDSLIRIDMSDYMEKHNASRLVGAPPGYVGYEEGGVLTEKVRKNPYSVVLLDEIEKAHPDVFNLLLQVLEEGELKDSLGHAVNFKNTVIIMTSNAGARQITTDSRVGFSSLDSGLLEYEDIKSNALAELKKLLSPELLNRIDDTVVFTALSKEEVAVILHIQLKELESRLAEQGLSLAVRPAACDYLVENGYDPQYGARPMRRLIQRNIEDSLSIKLLSGEAEGKSSVIIDYKNDEFVVSFKKSTKRKNTEKANEIESVLV
ncbi:MAG: ATP-dependent Clp protease ATP-binding subunit [Spirochaetaceae bacterium]|nr:ATP-dependent Clp protease ATP-binding subunit [Spirochaetaceae bacterium]